MCVHAWIMRRLCLWVRALAADTYSLEGGNYFKCRQKIKARQSNKNHKTSSKINKNIYFDFYDNHDEQQIFILRFFNVWGRGGGLVVIVLTFHSDAPSLNPAG